MEKLTNKINTQESKDFTKAKAIIERLFSAFTTTIIQTIDGTSVDLRFTAHTKNFDYEYAVELKERNQDMTLYDKLPLTCRKLALMQGERRSNEKLLYLVMVNDSEYYIYDMDRTRLPIPIMWNIKKTQFKEKSEYVKMPTFFLDTSEAVNKGLI